ncbi:MAG: hypothetical protein HUK24_09310 [Sphaerochaetaceae bacterium]|nr:hypothetical protein [Sphaerochaetaceae bacterium]
MKEITICDITMAQNKDKGLSITFRDKLEIASLLDSIGVSAIEVEGVENGKTDLLRIKSIASSVKKSVLAVPVNPSLCDLDDIMVALKEATSPRLLVKIPVSTVQMEYIFHSKPDKVLETISSSIKACCEKCSDVEFIAQDASRSDMDFLLKAIDVAIESGAKTVTVCDTASSMLPEDFGEFIKTVTSHVGDKVIVGAQVNDGLHMANAALLAAIRNGARNIKVAACPVDNPSLMDMCQIITPMENVLGVHSSVNITAIKRISDRISEMCSVSTTKTAFDNSLKGEEHYGEKGGTLTKANTIEDVIVACRKLGYELSDEDEIKVYKAFQRIAEKRGNVSFKELDAIVATEAMQVHPTYVLENYLINAGSSITSTAHIVLKKGEAQVHGLSMGNGPVDAAMLAIEQIAGRHYELDDFQIQAITEGREAVGQSLVKLRSNGKLYSGIGISTDILGSVIRAYLNALNKILHEEAQ